MWQDALVSNPRVFHFYFRAQLLPLYGCRVKHEISDNPSLLGSLIQGEYYPVLWFALVYPSYQAASVEGDIHYSYTVVQIMTFKNAYHYNR